MTKRRNINLPQDSYDLMFEVVPTKQLKAVSAVQYCIASAGLVKEARKIIADDSLGTDDAMQQLVDLLT